MHVDNQNRYALLSPCLLPGVTAADYDIKTSARVVAFGDVHGAYTDWTALLQELGVVDADLNWSGGKTHLVSLGDLIDRGPGSRKVVELLMKLDEQAEQAGGARAYGAGQSRGDGDDRRPALCVTAGICRLCRG